MAKYVTKQRRQLLDYLSRHTDEQMTARQIAYELGFSDLNAVKPRLTELRKAGRVKAVGKQKDPLTGVSVAVYEVVERCWKTVT